jgi:hypothetical protein
MKPSPFEEKTKGMLNAAAYAASYYAMLGSRQKALARMETARILAPDDPTVLYLAAITQEASGNRSSAR